MFSVASPFSMFQPHLLTSLTIASGNLTLIANSPNTPLTIQITNHHGNQVPLLTFPARKSPVEQMVRDHQPTRKSQDHERTYHVNFE